MNEALKRRIAVLEHSNIGKVTVTFADGSKRKMKPLDALDAVVFCADGIPVDADVEAFAWLYKVRQEVMNYSNERI